MGRYYATAQGEDPSVAAAIEDHYKPVGPSDRVPTDPVAIAVALADKLDLLSLFWAIDEKPTGSKDPYALRRAALGVIRILLEGRVRLPLRRAIKSSLWSTIHDWDNSYHSVLLVSEVVDDPDGHVGEDGRPLRGRMFVHVRSPDRLKQFELRQGHQSIAFVLGDQAGVEGFEYEGHFWDQARIGFRDPFVTLSDLLAFFADRLKVQLREQGARHDLVDAVFALGAGRCRPPSPGGGGSDRRSGVGWQGEKDSTPSRPPSPAALADDLPPPGGGGASHRSDAPSLRGAVQDDLLLIVRRVEALGKFLDTEDGRNLLAGYKRATNILREEEKKSGERYDGEVDPKLLTEPEEKSLFEAIGAATGEAKAAVELEDFDRAMQALAKLRPPVDAFFDKVLVNAPEPNIRANRLKLLNRIRAATLTVADFSKVEG